MSVIVKSTEMSYKDPTTGEYTGINVVAEKKTSELLSEIQTAGNTQVAMINNILVPPSEDGQYILQCIVNSGNVTYIWVLINE